MAVAFVDPKGRLVSCQNSVYPEAWFRKNSELKEAYRDFFRRIPKVHRKLAGDEMTPDPLGLPVTLARLEDGCYLLMGGRSDQEETHFQGRLFEKLPAMEVHEQGKEWFRMPVLKPKEMKENLARTVDLLNRLNRYLARPDLPVLLSIVDTLDQLIVSTFDPERFDFKAILELLTSTLVLIAGGGGAFAFTYEYPGRMMTLWSGEHPEILEVLSHEWKRLGRVKDPGEAFAALVRDRVKHEFKTTVKGIRFKNNGATLYLGLIGGEGVYLQEALHALAGKAAVALGVSSLSTVFQESWKMVFNSISQGIIVVDNKGAILITNQAAKDSLKERGMAPAIGHSVKVCGLGSQIEEAIFSAVQNGCSFRHKRSSIGEGSSLAHLCWDVVPLSRDDGLNTGAILVFDNITATVQLKKEIRDWERLATAGEIAASLAHEIRNPLATAKAAIQLLKMDGALLKQEELLDKLNRELDRMNNILTNFLNIARPAEEKLEPLNLEHTLQELLFFLNSEAILHEIDLAASIPEEKLPVVLGSPNSIKQVCLNVARNAIEAMSGGGKLDISLFSNKGRVHIMFQDTGPGIPAENIAALTKPFFTTKPGGTGLGLAISSSILKAMGGNLKIESNLGKGTTVELTLPVYVD